MVGVENQMAVKNNPIQAFLNTGWRMTSDPTKQPGGFGKRQLYAYGKNVDSYCGGSHNAFDLAKRHGVRITSDWNMTVLNGTGWNTFGWTGVYGFIDHDGIARQMILGHLNQNPLNYLKVGDRIKPHDTIGHQGTSNNLGVAMASHLHIQFQNYEALNEWDFTCLGLNAYNIDVTTTKPTGKGTSEKTNSKYFNKYATRKNRKKAYFKGVVNSTNGMGAGLRKYSGGRYNVAHGPDLPDGSVVYIYQVMSNGFARVYSSSNDGFVHLDQIRVTKVY